MNTCDNTKRGYESNMDTIIRMIAKDAPIKAMAIQAKGIVERAREIHKTLPVATAALGRTLMAASMMGQQIKEKDGSVTLRINGGGPLGSILAVSDSDGNVRGYVQNGQVELPLKGPAKLDVGTAVGTNGSLTVIKDLKLKEPYVGTIPLVSGEIAEDITAYFAESEQIPTACALGVLVDKDLSVAVAGGYLIQLLPGATDEDIDKIEAGIARAGQVTTQLSQGLSAEALLRLVLADFDLELLETVPVEYRCYCSRDRMRRALISMGNSLRDVIFDIAGGIKDGRSYKAVQMGGPSGGCIPADLVDTPIDYKALSATGAIMGSGGMVVMDDSTCMVNIARFFLDFTARESCGKCVPCRIGTTRMMEILNRICDGQGQEGDIEMLEQLCVSIKDGSLCGLGQTAPNPVLTTIRYFRDEYEAHIRDKKCPAHECSALLKISIDPTKCKGCTVCARKCPVECISGERKTPHVIDQSSCIKCKQCVSSCKFDAIVVD